MLFAQYISLEIYAEKYKKCIVPVWRVENYEIAEVVDVVDVVQIVEKPLQSKKEEKWAEWHFGHFGGRALLCGSSVARRPPTCEHRRRKYLNIAIGEHQWN